MPIEEQKGNSPRKLRHKKGTLWLAKALEPYRVEIKRHFAKDNGEFMAGYTGLWNID